MDNFNIDNLGLNDLIDVIQIVRAKVVQINSMDQTVRVQYSGKDIKYEWIKFDRIKRVITSSSLLEEEKPLQSTNEVNPTNLVDLTSKSLDTYNSLNTESESVYSEYDKELDYVGLEATKAASQNVYSKNSNSYSPFNHSILNTGTVNKIAASKEIITPVKSLSVIF